MNTLMKACVCAGLLSAIFMFVWIIKGTLHIRFCAFGKVLRPHFSVIVKNEIIINKIKAEHNTSRCDESKHPKVHVSMGLVFAVSHLKTHRQEGGNVGEE